MLIITGTFKGKNYNENPISASDVAAAFNLPAMPRENDVHILRVNTSVLPKKDGKVIYKRGYKFIPEFDGFLNGESFRIRYVERIVNTKDGKKYFPDNVSWAGTSLPFSAKDYDKFVFICLSPNCITSPFARGNAYLELFDPQKEELMAETMAARYVRIMKEIMEGLSDDVVRARAKGLVVNKATVGLPETAPLANIKMRLLAMFQNNPEAFEAAWGANETMLRGLVRTAVDRGWIVHKGATSLNGRPGWEWNEGDRKGVVACYTDGTQNDFAALIAWANNPSNYDAVVEYITRLLNPGAATNISAEMSGSASAERDTKAKVLEAIQAGYIGFAGGQVRWINQDGEPEGNPIVEKTTRASYIDDAVLAFKGPGRLTKLNSILNKIDAATEAVA